MARKIICDLCRKEIDGRWFIFKVISTFTDKERKFDVCEDCYCKPRTLSLRELVIDAETPSIKA